MDIEVYDTALSAVYNGRHWSGSESWTRPAIFHVIGTAGTLSKYLYGYIYETHDENGWTEDYDVEGSVPFGERELPEWEEYLLQKS